jgi:hypothetical protein
MNKKVAEADQKMLKNLQAKQQEIIFQSQQ